MKLSILTATYNRAYLIERLYTSIVDNLYDELKIEWLIMDDGSTDNTEEIIQNFQEYDNLEIRYFKQDNQGKMCAINNLMEYVTGELVVECDSDDLFCDNSFKCIKEAFDNQDNIKDIYAFCFLKYDKNKKNIGKLFKNSKTTMFDLYFREGENGEKALVYLTKIRKMYQYELEDGEKFVTEARMHHKMDKNYKILCVNEPIMICEYQESGYSKNISRQFLMYPHGYYQYFHEILTEMDTGKINIQKRLYIIRNYILFSYLINKHVIKINGMSLINKFLIILMWIPGYIKSYEYKKKNTI